MLPSKSPKSSAKGERLLDNDRNACFAPRVEKLENELLYYRLGSDPDALIKLFGHLEANRDLARTVALNLSPSQALNRSMIDSKVAVVVNA